MSFKNIAIISAVLYIGYLALVKAKMPAPQPTVPPAAA
jgi:hypothetical protein